MISSVMPVLAFIAALLGGCHRSPLHKESGPLIQRGYLWQRNWTPAVADAAMEAEKRMDGIVILGAEIVWREGKPHTIEANIPWEALRSFKKKCAVALRIAPFSGVFAPNDATIQAISRVVKSLLADAKIHGVELNEFQLDFDCAQKKLPGYQVWLRALHPLVPFRFVITALPAWLDEADFANLASMVDGYVLQVHSVPTKGESGQAMLCDPSLARKWVAKAANLGLPFSVALPTYRCVAGYDSSGKLLGVVMDSVQQSWPPGTRILEFATNADEISGLVNEWQKRRPEGLRELLWYRVPVDTDAMNWRWPTLVAVMAGRKPEHNLEVIREGQNPVDLSLVNNGEAEESFDGDVILTWNNASSVSCDALPGWTIRVKEMRAVFTPASSRRLLLSPGGRRGIGWLRYDQVPTLRLEIVERRQPPH